MPIVLRLFVILSISYLVLRTECGSDCSNFGHCLLVTFC